MLFFVAPTFDKSHTWLSLLLCGLLIFTPTDHRFAVLTFIAGAGLGYYLELWGTTRECWTYYTFQKPPLFAVLAHGMAAVAFWRTGLVIKQLFEVESRKCSRLLPFNFRHPQPKNLEKTNMTFIAFRSDGRHFPL